MLKYAAVFSLPPEYQRELDALLAVLGGDPRLDAEKLAIAAHEEVERLQAIGRSNTKESFDDFWRDVKFKEAEVKQRREEILRPGGSSSGGASGTLHSRGGRYLLERIVQAMDRAPSDRAREDLRHLTYLAAAGVLLPDPIEREKRCRALTQALQVVAHTS